MHETPPGRQNTLKRVFFVYAHQFGRVVEVEFSANTCANCRMNLLLSVYRCCCDNNQRIWYNKEANLLNDI